MLQNISIQSKEFTNTEIADFAKSVLDTALPIEETSLSHSFDVQVNQEKGYLDFIPMLPTSYSLDSDFCKRLQHVLVGALYPYFNVFASPAPNFKPTGSDRLNDARSLRIYFRKGLYHRLKFAKLSDCTAKTNDGYHYVIPLMNGYNYRISTDDVGHIGLTGGSGNGKTMLLLYFAQCFLTINAQLILIDPKLDTALYQFAQRNSEIKYYNPSAGDNTSVFMSEVLKQLSEVVDLIHYRQQELIRNPKKMFQPYVVFIDEALALTSFLNKKQKDMYSSLIDTITLMGRSTSIVLIIAAQGMEANTTMSSTSRDQLGLKVVLSPNPSTTETRYLMKDYDPSSVVINKDGFNKGLGLAQMQSDNLIVPFMAPYIGSVD